MKTKNLVFSIFFTITTTSLLKCAEMEQEKWNAEVKKKISETLSSKITEQSLINIIANYAEQTNYDKLLALFPEMEPFLKSNNISKDDVNNTKHFFYSIKHKTASYKKDDLLICFIPIKFTQQWEVVKYKWVDLNEVVVLPLFGPGE